MSSTRLSLCALSIAAFAHAALAQPSITNGSLTGTVASSTLPTGWTPPQGTPDTCDTTGPFNYTGHAWVLSPDGGTFVRAGGPGAGTAEALGQTLTGFDIGTTYQIDFFQTNLAHAHPSTSAYTGDTGNWEFFLDGSLVASSSAMAPPPTIDDFNVWEATSISFVATATTHDLMIAANTLGTYAAYMGIDGLHISEVPLPGTTGLIALVGLRALRRRR